MERTNSHSNGAAQMPITQSQVERLISGVLGGYRALKEMSKTHNNHEVKSDLFTGSVDISVANNMYLGEIIQNLFSLKATTPIMVHDVISHKQSFEGGLPTSKQITMFEQAYTEKMDEAVNRIVDYAAEQKEQVKANTGAIKEKLAALERHVALKNEFKVADLLDEIASIMSWGSRIETGPLYEACKNLYSLAGYNASFGVPRAAVLVNDLGRTLDEARVARISFYNPFTGKPVPKRFTAKETPDQAYEGPIDTLIIAEELVRTNDRLDAQKTFVEVNPQDN